MVGTCEKHDDMIKVVIETKTLVGEILKNHLPHIKEMVVETRRWVIAVFTAIVIAVILGGLKLFGVL
uniref:Uncharacterized protein n=1 Tax=viral metagenome TaxID=1070528 RepID=A0A6M3IQF6_9ZZZZ